MYALEKFAKEGEVLKHWLLIKLDLISKDKRRTLSKKAKEIFQPLNQ